MHRSSLPLGSFSNTLKSDIFSKAKTVSNQTSFQEHLGDPSALRKVSPRSGNRNRQPPKTPGWNGGGNGFGGGHNWPRMAWPCPGINKGENGCTWEWGASRWFPLSHVLLADFVGVNTPKMVIFGEESGRLDKRMLGKLRNEKIWEGKTARRVKYQPSPSTVTGVYSMPTPAQCHPSRK